MAEEKPERYVPSNDLVKIAVRESTSEVERLRKEASRLFSAAHIKLQPSTKSQEETLHTIRTVLEEAVHGAIETWAFRNVTLYQDAHSRPFPVCDSKGKFVPEMAEGLSECFPIRRPARFLQALGKDLVAYVTRNGGVNNPLYTLYTDSLGVNYRISNAVKLPPRIHENRLVRIERNV